MTIDLRAITKCNLGTLISGTISDSQLANAGLIFTRGNCRISDVIAPAVGTQVTFSYIKRIGADGIPIERSIRRMLYVIGSSANPATGTTDVEFCCRLTALRSFSEDKKYSARNAALVDDDTALTEEDEAIVTRPISAENLVQNILGKLGLTKTGATLGYTFSVPSIDVSGGYVNLLNDLLASENLIGYQSTDSAIKVVSSNLNAATSAARIGLDEVLELEPLSIGDPPPESMEVRYSTVKLKEPDDTETEKLNWELQESYGEPTTVTVDVPPYVTTVVAGTTLPATNRTFSYTYTPYTKVETAYDTLDRVVQRVTTERTILAAIAPGYVQANGVTLIPQPTGPGSFVVTALPPPSGNNSLTIVTTETTSYRVPAPIVFPTPPDYDPNYPTGYEEITAVTTEVSEPVLKLIASTNIYRYAGEQGIGFTYANSDTMRFIASREVRTQESTKGLQGQQIVKTLTELYRCRAYTIPGQQAMVEAIDRLAENNQLFGGRDVGIIIDAQSLEKIGVRTDITSGREIGLQQRPPQSKRTLEQWATTQETESETLKLESGMGNASVSMPYCPHDRFIKQGATYKVQEPIPSAADCARAFGRNAVAVLMGLRHGLALRTAPEKIPAAPMLSMALVNNGSSGYYMPSSISYVMDANGIIASADLLLIGGGFGSMASAWFPVAAGVTAGSTQPTETTLFPTEYLGQIATVGGNAQTTLNTAYPGASVGDGVQAEDTLDIWRYDGSVWVNVGGDPRTTYDPIPPVATVSITPQLSAATSTSVTVQRLPYALALQTALSLVTKTQLQAQKVVLVDVPLTTIGVAANAPDVAIGAAVQVPSTDIALAALAPAVSVSTVVAVPLTSMALAAFAPTQAGADDTVISVPLTSIAVAAQVPEGVGADLETFYNSWRLQVYGTDAWVYPDWWAD